MDHKEATNQEMNEKIEEIISDENHVMVCVYKTSYTEGLIMKNLEIEEAYMAIQRVMEFLAEKMSDPTVTKNKRRMDS